MRTGRGKYCAPSAGRPAVLLSLPIACAGLGFITGVPAILLGLFARRAARRGGQTLAIGGIVLGLIGCALSGLALTP